MSKTLAEYDAKVLEALRADGEALAGCRHSDGLAVALVAIRAIPGGQLSRERINKALRAAFAAGPSESIEDAVLGALDIPMDRR